MVLLLAANCFQIGCRSMKGWVILICLMEKSGSCKTELSRSELSWSALLYLKDVVKPNSKMVLTQVVSEEVLKHVVT